LVSQRSSKKRCQITEPPYTASFIRWTVQTIFEGIDLTILIKGFSIFPHLAFILIANNIVEGVSGFQGSDFCCGLCHIEELAGVFFMIHDKLTIDALMLD
jgi:hypothetical protein